MLSSKLAAQIRKIASSGYDELYVHEHEYIKADKPTFIEEALGIFQLIDIEPVAYQLGHKFYNAERRRFFTCVRDQSLQQVKYRLGTYVLWMPTIDHMLQQALADEIRIGFYPSTKSPDMLYRTIVHDLRFPFYTRDYELYKNYRSTDPWTAIALSLARVYKRRLDEFGAETISYPIFIEDKKMRLEPIVITDQSPFN